MARLSLLVLGGIVVLSTTSSAPQLPAPSQDQHPAGDKLLAAALHAHARTSTRVEVLFVGQVLWPANVALTPCAPASPRACSTHTCCTHAHARMSASPSHPAHGMRVRVHVRWLCSQHTCQMTQMLSGAAGHVLRACVWRWWL